MTGADDDVDAPLATLLRCLDLEALDRDLHLGDPGPGEGRLFGGMVAALVVTVGDWRCKRGLCRLVLMPLVCSHLMNPSRTRPVDGGWLTR